MLESSIQVLSGLRRHAFSAIALAGALMLIAAPASAQTNRTIDLSVSPSQLSETDGTKSVTVTARLRGAAITEDITVTPTATGLGTDDADHVQPNTFTFSPATITITAGSVEGSTMGDIDPLNDDHVNKDNVITVSGTATSSLTGFTATVEGATLTLRNEDRLPVLLGRSVDGPALTLTYNKAMSGTVNPRHFTVLVGGVANTVASATVDATDAPKKVVLTLGVAVKAGETVTISYTKARTSDASAAITLKDTGDNEAPDFSGAVTNVTKIPTVTIRRPATETGPVKDDAFTVEIVFSEAVGGQPAGQTANAFVDSDITVTNGGVDTGPTLAGTQPTDGSQVYEVEIDPDEEGSVTIGVAASVTTSTRSGTPNRAATSLTVRSDQTVPRVTSITGSPGSGAFPVYINFSEDVTIADKSFGSVSTITGGSATDWKAVGNSKRRFQTTVTPSQPTDRATDPTVAVVITFPVDGATDLAGNTNAAALSRTFTTRPAALRLTASGYPSTTTNSPWTRGDFNITFTFSSSVASFAATNVNVGSGAVVEGSFTPIGTRQYRATIRPSDTPVTIDVSGITDGGGTESYPALTQVTVHVAVGPSPTIAVGAVQTGGATSRDVTVTFTPAVTGFTASDLRVTNGTASNLRATTPGTVYDVAITPRADGNVTVTVPANVATAVEAVGGRRPGNVSSATTTPFVGYARSGVTLSKRLGAEAGAFPVTITFADPEGVDGLMEEDIKVTNGSVLENSLTPDATTRTTSYRASIEPTRSGTVTVRVPANVAQDLGGLGNLASNTLSVSVDLDARIKLTVSPDRISESAGPTEVTVTAEVQGTPFPDERTVQVTISGASGRFSAQPGTFNLAVPANSSSGSGRFTLIPTANTADDGNANVSITGSITGGDRVIAATLRILDDDGRDDDDDDTGGGGGGGGGADRIRLSVTPVTIAENAGPTQVRLTAHVEDDDGDATSYDREVTVSVKVASSPATGAVGFEPIADFEMEIGEGREREVRLITVTPIDDDVPQANATLTFSGTSSVNDPVRAATLTLTNDDEAAITELAVTLDPVTIAEDAGATDVTVTVGLPRKSVTGQTISVSVAGSGTAGAVQFAPVPNFTVTVAAGDSLGTGTFSITPVNNTFDETNETVTVTATVGSVTQTGTLTITDDDAAPTGITLTASPATISESAGATAVTVTATVKGNSTYGANQVLPISVKGSGASGVVGFATVPEFSITIERGQSSATGRFTLRPEADVADEMNETVSISSTHAAVTATTITLTDDDAAPTGVALAVSPASVSEGAGPTTVTVTATVQGGTTYGTDQQLSLSASGSGQEGVVSFAPVADFSLTIPAAQASATATFTLSPVDNIIDEGNESVTVSSGAANVSSASLTITDDDDPPTGISFSLDPGSVSEGQGATTVAVTALVEGGTAYGADQTITMSVSGSGAPGVVGFAPVANFDVTIEAGEVRGRGAFTLTPEDDVVDEDDETITVSSSNAAALRSATLTLRDDDAAPTGISLTASPAMVSEGAGATMVTVMANVLGGTTYNSAQNVPVSVAGSGAAGVVGFAPVAGISISIAAGAASGSATFTVTPEDDIVDEADETITLTANHGGATPTTTLMLTDDDAAPTGIAISVDPTTISEGAGSTSVTVTATVEGGTLYAMDQMGSISAMGSGTSGAVGFAPVQAFDIIVAAGAASAVGTFSITPDDNRERNSDETVTVSLRHMGTTSEATIALVDNDQDISRIEVVSHHVLPELARAMASSSVGAVADRISRARSYSGNSALSIGGYSSIGGLAQGLRSRQHSQHPMSWHQRLRGTSFAVSPLNSALGVAGRITIWGEGDYRTFSGNQGNVDWDGSLLGMHLGADADIGAGALVGVSLSRTAGDVDYDYSGPHTAGGGSLSGTYSASMQNIMPYASWMWAPGSSIWASAGFGSGEVEIADREISGEETADSRQTTTAVGVNLRLLTNRGSAQTTTLDVKSQAWQSEIEVDANGSAIRASTVSVNRVYVALEGAYARQMSGGGTISPFIEVGMRSDGGDGLTGLGVELGGGLRFSQPSIGLRAEGRGRTLLAHGGDVQEFGIGGSVSVTPGEGGRGMAIELGTTSGSIASGMYRISGDRDMMPGTSAFDMAPRLHSQVGYGLDVRGGLLRPYGGVEYSGPMGLNSRFGTQYRMGRRFNVGVEVAHYTLPGQPSAAPMVRGVISVY